MPLAQDTTAWTDIGRKVVTPSYYAYVNGTFVNLNAPGGSALLSIDKSVGVKKSQFVPKKGEVNLGNTDPLPTTKQPSEFNCALGVGVLLGFQKPLLMMMKSGSMRLRLSLRRRTRSTFPAVHSACSAAGQLLQSADAPNLAPTTSSITPSTCPSRMRRST